MRKPLTLVVLILISITATNAQQRRLDSVLALNNAYHAEDSLKAVYLREVFRAYSSVKNYAKTQLYIDSALQLASRLPYKSLLPYALYRAGSAYHYIDRFKAIEYYNKAIEAAKAVAFPSGAGYYLNLGSLYMSLQDYPKSLEAHEKALQWASQYNNTDVMSSCYMNMSYIYVNMGQKVKALEYINKALKHFEASKSDRGIAIAYEEMADMYFDATDRELRDMGLNPADRLKYIAEVLDKGLKRALLVPRDNALQAAFYNKMARMYELQGNLVAAKKHYDGSLELAKGAIDEEEYGDQRITAGKFYADKLNDPDHGIALIRSALLSSERSAYIGTTEAALNALSETFQKKGRFDSALYYYRKAIVVRDTIFSRAKEQEITRRQLTIDFDIKERDYKSAQQLADARLKEQQQQILLRNQQLLISDKEKTLQRLTFLQEQTELQKQRDLQENLLKQEHVKAEYDKQISSQQIRLKNVQLDTNRWLSIGLGIVAVIVFAAALLIYNSRRKTLKLNRVVSLQKKSLEELVSVKDKIFSVVSHDMKGPVNNLIAFSSLLDDGDIEQERLALYMQQIKGTLDHTSALMENLLNWSASQMKGFSPVIENIDISTAVQQALQGIEQPLQKKKISLHNTVMPGVYIKGDRNMTELIIRNLVNNAVKFSQQGGRLEVSSRPGKDKVVLTIKDDGVGMDAGKVQQINSASLHSIESTFGTAKEKGTGLGLMLSKHFADLMGGNISVESKPGAGSRFDVSLPGGV